MNDDIKRKKIVAEVEKEWNDKQKTGNYTKNGKRK